MKIQFKNRFTGAVIYETEADTVKAGLVIAVGLKINLGGADLRGADLRGADLRGAYLGGAYLGGADLGGADLGGAKLNWNSHQLLSELLHRAAGGDFIKISFAGAVRIHTEWCWERWQEETPADTWDWMLSVFSGYVTEGDTAPDVVTNWKKQHKAKK